MAKVQYDENGFPIKQGKAETGNLTIRLDAQGWEVLTGLREQWSKEKNFTLTITDVVRAALVTARKAIDAPPAPPPAPAPLPPALPSDTLQELLYLQSTLRCPEEEPLSREDAICRAVHQCYLAIQLTNEDVYDLVPQDAKPAPKRKARKS